MLFRLDCDWSSNDRSVKSANNFAEAASIFAFDVYGKGYGQMKIAESTSDRSVIVISPGRRPFRIEFAK